MRRGEQLTRSPELAAQRGAMRWTKTGDDPREVGRLGGRPPKLARCAGCGAMLSARERRGHKCA